MTKTRANVTVLRTQWIAPPDLARGGDDGFEGLRRSHLASVCAAVTNYTETVPTGDGIMAVFANRTDALACAESIEKAVVRLRRRDMRSLAVRVGLSFGEATSEDGEWSGTPVTEAAALCCAAEGGQVLTTAIFALLVGRSEGHSFVPLGERVLPGIGHPLAVVEFGWKSAPSAPIPLPPVAQLSTGEFLVGRSEEFGRLVRSWEEIHAGSRRVVLVSGEPGVGKTRLVTELARMAHAEGAVVLWGRCDEELAVAYQPFAEALRHWAANTPADDVAQRSDLIPMLPELGRGRPAVVAAVGADPQGERIMLFDGVRDLFGHLAERNPVLVVLDDLHWATADTLLLLRHLVRDAAPASLLIVGTYRDTDFDRTHPLADVLADLRREENVDRLALGGLDEAGVVDFVEAASGEALDDVGTAWALAIHHHTEGNPFFVGQMLRHLSESGGVVRADGHWRPTVPLDQLGIPEGIREVVGRRLARLSDGANQMLIVAAVAGRQFDLATLEGVAEGTDADALLTEVEQAVAAHLVDEVRDIPGRFSFAHALIRETLLAELTASRRGRLHRSIGRSLAQRSDAVPAAVVAHHLCLGASPDSVGEAIGWAELAINQAWGQTAFVEAIAIGQLALKALDLAGMRSPAARSRLMVLTAGSMAYSGDIGGAHVLADEAIATAREADEPAALAEAVLARFSWPRAGVPDLGASELLSEALDRVGDDALALRARLLATRSLYRGVNLGEGLAAEPESQRAWELAQRSGDSRAQLFALAARGTVVIGSPALEIMRTVVRDMDRLLESAPAEDGEIHLLDRARTALVLRVTAGDRAGAEDAIAQGGQLARRRGGGRLAAAMVGMWNAMLALCDGCLDMAEENAAALLPMAGIDVNFQNSWSSLMFRIEQERGRAGALLPIVQAAAEQTPGLVTLRAVLALTLAEVGEYDEARSVFAELTRDDLAAVPRDVAWSASLSQLSELCVLVGDPTVAANLHELLRPFSGQMLLTAWGVYCPGAADRYLGALAGLMSRHDEIDDRFDAALALEEGMGATALAARTRVWWARALVERGGPDDRGRARSLLDEATEVCEPLGLVAITREATAVAARLMI